MSYLHSTRLISGRPQFTWTPKQSEREKRGQAKFAICGFGLVRPDRAWFEGGFSCGQIDAETSDELDEAFILPTAFRASDNGMPLTGLRGQTVAAWRDEHCDNAVASSGRRVPDCLDRPNFVH